MLNVSRESIVPVDWLIVILRREVQVLAEQVPAQRLDDLARRPSPENRRRCSRRRRAAGTATARPAAPATARAVLLDEAQVDEVLHQPGEARTRRGEQRHADDTDEEHAEMRPRISRAAGDTPASRPMGAAPGRAFISAAFASSTVAMLMLHETELAQHVHGSHHRLVRGARVGAHGDRLCRGPRPPLRGCAARSVSRRSVDQLAFVDAVMPPA